MRFRTYSHRFAEAIIGADFDLNSEFTELTNTIAQISDEDLMSTIRRQRDDWTETQLERNRVVDQNKVRPKSLSVALNELLKKRLIAKNWSAESGIFRENEYSNSQSTWRLDFAKTHTSVEVAFNHAEAIAHNLIKPVLASQLNHVEKAVQTKVGIIITCTEALKTAGNFDGAVGTYEKFISYLKPYQNILTCPIVLIGLEAPETFVIDSKSRRIVESGMNDVNPLLL